MHNCFTAFSGLKSKSISELVLDLSYNGAGNVSSATALSIILARNIKSGKTTVESKFNLWINKKSQNSN